MTTKQATAVIKILLMEKIEELENNLEMCKHSEMEARWLRKEVEIYIEVLTMIEEER